MAAGAKPASKPLRRVMCRLGSSECEKAALPLAAVLSAPPIAHLRDLPMLIFQVAVALRFRPHDRATVHLACRDERNLTCGSRRKDSGVRSKLLWWDGIEDDLLLLP